MGDVAMGGDGAVVRVGADDGDGTVSGPPSVTAALLLSGVLEWSQAVATTIPSPAATASADRSGRWPSSLLGVTATIVGRSIVSAQRNDAADQHAAHDVPNGAFARTAARRFAAEAQDLLAVTPHPCAAK